MKLGSYDSEVIGKARKEWYSRSPRRKEFALNSQHIKQPREVEIENHKLCQ
jgi:hypothetical protein